MEEEKQEIIQKERLFKYKTPWRKSIYFVKEYNRLVSHFYP